MADLTFSIDTLYRQAFPDLASRPLAQLEGARDLAGAKLDLATGNAPKVDFGGVQAVKITQGTEMSYLGTPIFQPIRFLEGDYQVFGTGAQEGQMVKARYGTLRLPATSTAEFGRAHQIMKTAPSGADGTTKELWAFTDWDVTIRGLILHTDPHTFPADEVLFMRRWEEVADAIEVSGEMFELLGIKRLAIEKINFGRVAGMPNVVPFQIEASSDKPLEISLLNGRF